jgi:hypothetical protein
MLDRYDAAAAGAIECVLRGGDADGRKYTLSPGTAHLRLPHYQHKWGVQYDRTEEIEDGRTVYRYVEPTPPESP